MKWVPQALDIMKGVARVGNTFPNSFFVPVKASVLQQGLQPIQKTYMQQWEPVDNPYEVTVE